jgi:BlaI family penicillinase repressor
VPTPEGKLTPAQFEIMQIIWKSPDGLTVAEIWESISQTREVGRTTVLNLVDRLEKRGWLKRSKFEQVFRYTTAVNQQQATRQVASEFVNEFFQGSASELVLSLLGSHRLSAKEVDALRQMLDAAETQPPQRKGRRS